jgi:hypothetical protein
MEMHLANIFQEHDAIEYWIPPNQPESIGMIWSCPKQRPMLL